MGYGGNLTMPSKPLLYNTLAVTDFGYYTDSITSEKMLVIKDLGLAIPYVSGTTVKTKSCATAEQKKIVALDLDITCPCEECEYEFGIKIEKYVQKPGVLNSIYTPQSKFYGGRLPKVQECTSGEMADSDVLLMIKTIIEAIRDDVGTGGTKDDPAAVLAGMRYAFSDDDNTDNSVMTITIDGTTTTITADGSVANQMVAKINANTTVNPYVRADAYAEDYFYLSSKVNGQYFTAAAGTDITLESTNDLPQIVISQKEPGERFEVVFDDGFATKSTTGIVVLTGFTTVGSGTTTLYIDGTSVGASTDNTTVATMYGNLNTAIGAEDAYAYIYDGDDLYVSIVMGSTVSSFDLVFSATSTTSISGYAFSPLGKWAYLTADDVYREFSQLGHQGALAMQKRQTMPLADTDYCKYIIEWTQATASIHGASHGDTYKSTLVLYVAESAIDDLLWDDTNEMWENQTDADLDSGTFTADLSFTTMLAEWYS